MNRYLRILSPRLVSTLVLALLGSPAANSQDTTTSVQGRVRMPNEIPAGINSKGLSLSNAVIMLEGKYSHPRMPYPKNWSSMKPEQRREWQNAFENSDAYPAYERKVAAARAKRPTFVTKIAPDGAFAFEDIKPAWYQLTARIMAPNTEVGPYFELARAYALRQFFVKRADQPCRVGALTLKLKNVVMPGDTAPGWIAAGYDGSEFKLLDFRGQFVLFDFWATWCGPCIGEIPNLEAVHEEFGGDRFKVIGLSVDNNIKLPQAFLREKPSGYLQGFISYEDRYPPVRNAYGIQGIPAIWLIAPDGKIIARDLRGPKMVEQVRRAIDAWKAKAPKPVVIKN